MTANVFSWKNLFFFCFGLFLASMFCMRLVESGFIHNGKPYSIMDLELYLDRDGLSQLFMNLNEEAALATRYHLYFDFFFMAGVFPGLTSICMLTRYKTGNKIIRSLLFVFAFLQFVAWGFDMSENIHLLKWLDNPASISGLTSFHLLVKLKFIFALGALALSLVAFVFFRKKSTNIQS